MKKKLLSIAALAALLFTPQVIIAEEAENPTEHLKATYDFTKLTVTTQPENLNGSAANGQAFYAWENSEKTDSKRQDYKGYTWKEGLALPEVCHVWRRSDRINNNIIPEGLKCPSDKEMVVDGLQEGSVVKIYYDASATVTTNAETGEASEPAQIIWVAALKSVTVGEGENAVTTLEPTIEATVGEETAVTGETKIASGEAITVTKFIIDENHVGGYIPFKVFKGMVISKIEITTGETTETYDFTKLTVTTQPENLNGSAANGQAFYAWENSEKTDSKRQDYKGYTWKEGLALPEVCHVWRRSDRINNNIIPEGLKCPSDKEMVVDGLQEGSVVKIYYDASATVTTNAETGEASEPAQIIWVAALKSVTVGEGENAVTTLEPTIEATVGEETAVTGETKIASGEAITVTKFIIDENHVGGYIPFKVIKGMIISKIEIDYDETTVGIEAIQQTVIRNKAIYNLNGQQMNGMLKSGLYIVNGKKVVIK